MSGRLVLVASLILVAGMIAFMVGYNSPPKMPKPCVAEQETCEEGICTAQGKCYCGGREFK